MAKDGTGRGGSRPNAGRKKKAVAEKLAEGNPGGRPLTVLPSDLDIPNLEGADMPPVQDYMKAKQKDGKYLVADEIYAETWNWLREYKCERLVGRQVLSQYAMVCARLIHCEEAISEFGYLIKRANGSVATSPYVQMSNEYRKQANTLYYQIYQIVKENASVEISGVTPQDDMMERLLRSRKGI